MLKQHAQWLADWEIPSRNTGPHAQPHQHPFIPQQKPDWQAAEASPLGKALHNGYDPLYPPPPPGLFDISGIKSCTKTSAPVCLVGDRATAFQRPRLAPVPDHVPLPSGLLEDKSTSEGSCDEESSKSSVDEDVIVRRKDEPCVAAEEVVHGDSACPLDGVVQSSHSMRINLQGLKNFGSNRIVLVRRIHQLSFDSAEILREHYSWYGKVEHVFVSHTRSMLHSGTQKFRPSKVGFVVMSTASEVEAILADGQEQLILRRGVAVKINASKFERHSCDELGGC
jgi:hypothetical protein